MSTSSSASHSRSTSLSDSSLSPEQKHKLFESKRKEVYGRMGDLLKRRAMMDDEDEDE